MTLHYPTLHCSGRKLEGGSYKAFESFFYVVNDMNHRGLSEEAEIAGKQKWQVKVKNVLSAAAYGGRQTHLYLFSRVFVT